MTPAQLVLASASPARKRLLTEIGVDPLIRPSHIDESQVQTRDPVELVQTLAYQKAMAIAEELKQTHHPLPLLVIGCDSVLAIQGEIHGKPANPATAIARWQQMRGQVGDLYTGHAVIEILATGATPEMRHLVRCQVTRVYFAKVSDAQIAAYVATGEPLACAGCFALEGKGSLFVDKIEGCHSNVIGLSLPLFRQMLNDLGYDITNFWRSS
ncbi:MAG: nucleoside triphosphate pyrophosphatase [Leptolyngbyaceae cyanobacterium]